MAELGIIIPTLNAGPVLGPTLGALAEMESVGLIKDLVVSDGVPRTERKRPLSMRVLS